MAPVEASLDVAPGRAKGARSAGSGLVRRPWKVDDDVALAVLGTDAL